MRGLTIIDEKATAIGRDGVGSERLHMSIGAEKRIDTKGSNGRCVLSGTFAPRLPSCPCPEPCGGRPWN